MYQRKKKNFLVKFFKRFLKRAPILFRRQQKKVARFFRVFKKSFLNPIGTYISEKYSKIKNPILLTRLATIAIVIAMIGGFSYRVFATPPTSPYTAGETLNPTCAPGDANCTVTTSGASGSGTTGYIPKWTGSSTLGDSMIKDTGSRIEIGTVEAGITGGALVVGGNILPSNLTANISSYTLGDFSVVWGGVHTDYVRGSGGIFNITGSSSKAIFSDNDTGGLGVVIKSHGTQVAQFGDGTNPYVGIGTASPTYSLHVVGNSRIETGSGKYVTIDSVDSGNGVSLLLSGSASDIIGISNFNTYFNQGKVFLYGYSSIAGGTDANRGDFLFRNEYNSTNLMYLSSDGKLGIGTTTPSSKLDITTTGLGVTQTTTSGLALVNTTAAADGAQQISPAIRWSAKGWKTDATAGSQAVDFRSYVVPVQGTANPSGYLTFESSINGGAYTANQFNLSSNGNVGIGEAANGSDKLLVNGSIRSYGAFLSEGLYAGFGTTGYGFVFGSANGSGGSRIYLYQEAHATLPEGLQIFNGSRVNTTFYDGKVGIGTASPSTILEIGSSDMGTGNAGPIITLGRNTNTTTGAGSIDFLRKDGTHGYVWQDSAGEMRINTTISPSDANDTSGTVIGTQSSSLSSKNLAGLFTDYSNALDTIVNAPLYNFTYKSGAFNNQQFTGIITDYTPEFGMDKDASHPAGKSLNVITGLGYTFGAIKELNAITVQYDTNNNVGIGTENPFEKLHVSDVTTSGIVARFENNTGTCDINPTTSSLTCSSDINKKKNITSLDETSKVLTISDYYSPEEMNLRIGLTDEKTILDKINMLTPVTYNWNTESDFDKKHIGFIAQEVEQLFPDLVETDPRTGFKSLNYGGFTPYLIKGFQEQQKQIEELKLQIAGISAILTPQSSVLSMMTEFFSSVVLQVSGGVGYLKDITVETLKIGSPEKRTGITLFDEVTGEPYCISVANGAQKITSGECSVVLASPDSNGDTGESSGLGGGGILADPIIPDESGGGTDVTTGDGQTLTPTDGASSGTSSSDSSITTDNSSEPQTQTTPTPTTETIIETTSI